MKLHNKLSYEFMYKLVKDKPGMDMNKCIVQNSKNIYLNTSGLLWNNFKAI